MTRQRFVVAQLVFGLVLAGPRALAAQAPVTTGAAATTMPAADGGGQTGAHPAASVRLLQDPCVADKYDVAELPPLLELELGSLGVTKLDSAPLPATANVNDAGLAVVSVGCTSDAHAVLLRVLDLVTKTEVRRELILSDVDVSARARALSLAAAELVETVWFGATATAHAPPSGLPTAISDALVARLRAASPRARPPQALDVALAPTPAPQGLASGVQLDLTAIARSFPSRSTGLFGTQLGLSIDLSRPLRLALDVEGTLGSQDISDASGPVATMHLYALTAGAGLFLVSPTMLELSVGPFVRAGYAAAKVTDLQRGAKAGDRPHGGLLQIGLGSQLRAPLTAAWRLLVGLDVGYLPVGVAFKADLNRTAGIAELTLAVRIGVACLL